MYVVHQLLIPNANSIIKFFSVEVYIYIWYVYVCTYIGIHLQPQLVKVISVKSTQYYPHNAYGSMNYLTNLKGHQD